MSFFCNLFGCKKKNINEPSSSRSTEVDALEKLRSTEKMLREKREVLETNIKKEQATVKENVNKNKQVTLNALNRKKSYEQQLSRNDNMLSTVVEQRSVLEIVNTYNIVVDVMSSTSYAIEMAERNVNIDDIHDIIDDIATSQDLTQKLSEAICIPTRSETDEDEEELEKLNEPETNTDQVLATNYPMKVVPKCTQK